METLKNKIMKNHKEKLKKIKEHIDSKSKKEVRNELIECGLKTYKNTKNVIDHHKK